VGRQSHIDETGVPHGWNGGPTHVELCTQPFVSKSSY